MSVFCLSALRLTINVTAAIQSCNHHHHHLLPLAFLRPLATASTASKRRNASGKQKQSAVRRKGRFQFRSPRYFRGPLNPIQPPPPSAPISREFIPGPFTSERLYEHYNSTLASDILTMTYDHIPFGYEPPPKPPRLRPWDDSSPYYKNRPLRGPRGGSTLPLLTPPRNFRNIPKLEAVTVHTFVRGAIRDTAFLRTAGYAIQAITGVRATVHYSRHHIAPWDLKEDVPISLTSKIYGQQAYRFLASCVDIVMPRIKDYSGVKGASGDNSGNIMFGFTPDQVSLFPEIEVNYDMYPPKQIPGCHVTVHTSATNDRDARLLLTSFGVPLYGKFAD